MIKMMPYVIAEVSSNWTCLGDLLLSIERAKESGANAVKFQLFTHESLYGYSDKSSVINKHSLSPDWLQVLSNKCIAVDIDFMCSAFSVEEYRLVDPYVSMHKLASAEMLHIGLLSYLRSTGKHLCLSTGGHSLDDVGMALDFLGMDNNDYTLMYCVADYPAHVVNLNQIERLKDRFNCSVGYSDHTTDVLMIPRIAHVNYGAQVIEKHFNAIESIGPDSGHSLNPAEFKLMVDSIKGDTRHHPLELEMTSKWRRRLMVTQDVKHGQDLVLGVNFGTYRSKVWLPIEDSLLPYRESEVNGMKAKTDLVQGHPLRLSDVYGLR